MTSSTKTQEAAQLHYLATGEHDSLFSGWPGDDMFDAARKGDAALRSVLTRRFGRAVHTRLSRLPCKR